MRSILSTSGRKILESHAGDGLLIVLDYDGTLSPIVRDPRKAVMRPRTRRLLRAAAEAYPVAIVSGRSRKSVFKVLGGIPVAYAVGNHGMEWPGSLAQLKTQKRRIRRWKKLLTAELGMIPGIEIEDKKLSLSFHYRQCPDRRRAAARIADALERLRGIRVVAGKMVFNVVPRGAPDKGTAINKLLKKSRCARGIFVGDDVTDEDAFAAARGREWLTVRVGRSTRSKAKYCLRDQIEIDELLQVLIETGSGLHA